LPQRAERSDPDHSGDRGSAGANPSPRAGKPTHQVAQGTPGPAHSCVPGSVARLHVLGELRRPGPDGREDRSSRAGRHLEEASNLRIRGLATVAAPPAPAAQGTEVDTRFFGHPRGLSTLFFTEFWERFSYYGMRAILILFMTAPIAAGGLGFDTAKAGVVYGPYTCLVCFASLPGGWIADRFLGQRRATLYGGIVIMLGHIFLAIPTIATFYLGLGCVVLGTGLLKPNVSTMVGQLYPHEDTRRDAGFSIFYMGINLGAFVSPLVCGWLAQGPQFGAILARVGIRPESSWHWGFGAAAVGMFFGILQYLAGWKHLGDSGMVPVVPDDPAAQVRNRRRLQIGIFGTVGLIIAIYALGRSGLM